MVNRVVNPAFDLQPGFHHIYEIELINKYVKGESILDIGCWSGQFLSLIQQASKITGLDPNKNAIAFAKQHRKGTYIVGSALSLPFENNSFDVVTMWDVIEHLPKRTEQKAIQEATRALKKNGIFALSTPTNNPISIITDLAYFLIEHRHYSEKYLVNLLFANGLKIIKIEYGGGIWTLIKSNIDLLVKHIFGKKLKLSFLDKLVKNEYKGNGFSEIHIIAQKK